MLKLKQELQLIPITIDEEQNENEIPQPTAILDVLPELPQREVKVMHLVKCEKCNRKMLEQTLKYKHQESCPGNKTKQPKQPKNKEINVEPIEDI